MVIALANSLLLLSLLLFLFLLLVHIVVVRFNVLYLFGNGISLEPREQLFVAESGTKIFHPFVNPASNDD